MGWFQKLGNSIKNGAQRLGQHVAHGVEKATRLVDHVAHAIDTGAGKVASVAGTVAKYAGMASAVPVVGELAAGIAAGAKGVQGAALGVQGAAQMAVKGTERVKQIERTVKKAAKELSANPNMADAKRYGQEISSMTRHSARDVKDAGSHMRGIASTFSKIRGGP